MLRFTVLGRYGPYPRVGGACSGYLIEDGETRVLLDCGAGVYARLIESCAPWALSAVVLSHLHYDHCSDLFVMQYALDQRKDDAAPLPLYAPCEPQETLKPLMGKTAFSLHSIEAGQTLPIGSMTLRFFATRHPVPTCGVDITSAAGARLVYTGDTGWFDGLVEKCRDADALLCDACFTGDAANEKPVHLTARQAGLLAKEADVPTLYCTHLSGGTDSEKTVEKEVDFTHAVVVQERGQYTVLSRKRA